MFCEANGYCNRIFVVIKTMYIVFDGNNTNYIILRPGKHYSVMNRDSDSMRLCIKIVYDDKPNDRNERHYPKYFGTIIMFARLPKENS